MQLHEIMTEKSQAERKEQAGVHADQFFLRPEIAKQYANWIKSQPFYSDVTRIIEPAAGAKDVADHFPNIEMYDLFPQSDDIIQQDFLTAQFEYQPGILVITNSPYGKANALAVQFFNKAAEFADYIATIVPRSFRRENIQNRLSHNFKLLDSYDLPDGSFYLPAEGPEYPYHVPSVAQIWVRTDEQREKKKFKKRSEHFQFVQGPDQADFAFRRIGGRAGQILDDPQQAKTGSFYFIKGGPNVRRAFDRVDWSQYGHDVTAARSINRATVVDAVEHYLNKPHENATYKR